MLGVLKDIASSLLAIQSQLAASGHNFISLLDTPKTVTDVGPLMQNSGGYAFEPI